jgi:Na+-translocating ferredoxin:NAD+ oxidoreductase RnfG subunit
MPGWVMPAATGLLGAALLLYAVSETAHESAFCRAVKRWGRGGTFPLLLGLLTGANICPPFVTAMADALKSGGALNGLAYFVAFFAATSLVSLPLLVLSLGSFLPAVQSLGRAACGIVGFILICTAARYVSPAEGAPVEVLDVKPETALLQQLLPEAREFRELQKPMRHFVGTASGRKVGIVVFSSDLAPEVRGFGGPVPAAVSLDPDGRIVDARVLPNQETEGYGDQASKPEFAAQFRGKRYSDPLTLGHGVDGITGATITSSAVTDGVRLTARRAAEQILGLSAPGGAAARRVRFNLWYLAVPAFFILAAIGEARLRRLRPLVLAASILCLGFGLKAFFSLMHILDIAAGEAPPLATHALWYLLTVLALGSALLAGRLYCAWVCPFGALTEFLGKIFRSPLEISTP